MKFEEYPKSNDPNDGWQLEIPKEPDSHWWFCGWVCRVAISAGFTASVHRVLIRETLSGCIYYVADGCCIHPEADKCVGLWKRIERFSVPTLDRILPRGA